MPEEQSPTQMTLELEAVCNNKNFSTIPNSNSEFCIYTYKAEYESYAQIARKGFFNPAATFLNPGDTVRVFRFDIQGNLEHFLNYIVMSVDKINRKVVVACTLNTNLKNKIIE